MRWFMLGGDGPDHIAFLDDGRVFHLLPQAESPGQSRLIDLLGEHTSRKAFEQNLRSMDQAEPAGWGVAPAHPPRDPKEPMSILSAYGELARSGRFVEDLSFKLVEDRVEDLPSPVGRWNEYEVASFLPPLNPPAGDVIAIGRNYAEHAAEMKRATGKSPERPTVFSKAQTTINGPFDPIVVDPSISSQVDWEAELGVVIGFECRNVSPEQALDFVFGYTILNDLSARDIQYGWGGQYYKGKSIDGYCPIGPWIVTADEIPDPQHLDITLRVNGEIKQQGNTADMIFPVAELVSQLSLGQTLRPGTLIGTGTPPGVGYAREPKEFLQPGDVMETEISGIGMMRNEIVELSS